jgi:hypothetical protein
MRGGILAAGVVATVDVGIIPHRVSQPFCELRANLTLKTASVRQKLSYSAGLLVSKERHLTTPTSPGTTGGIAEGADAPVTLIRLSWATCAPPKRGYIMDDTTGGRLRRQRSGAVLGRLGLTISRSTGAGSLRV